MAHKKTLVVDGYISHMGKLLSKGDTLDGIGREQADKLVEMKIAHWMYSGEGEIDIDQDGEGETDIEQDGESEALPAPDAVAAIGAKPVKAWSRNK